MAAVAQRKIAGYGWKPDLPDIRDHVLAVEPPRTLPRAVSLRSRMPKPYDQGQLGSCTANAIAANLEYDARRQKRKNVKTPSRLFIYYSEREVEGTINEDAGAFIRDGIKCAAKLGAPVEKSYWPYDIERFAEKPPKKAYDNALRHQALAYARVPQTLTGLQSVLAAKLPIVFGFSVYETFESKAVADSGIVPMPRPNEAMVGGHAVLLVGYKTGDEGGVRFEVRNSWGTDWGDAGYAWFPAAYVLDRNLSSDFWTIRTTE